MDREEESIGFYLLSSVSSVVESLVVESSVVESCLCSKTTPSSGPVPRFLTMSSPASGPGYSGVPGSPPAFARRKIRRASAGQAGAYLQAEVFENHAVVWPRPSFSCDELTFQQT